MNILDECWDADEKYFNSRCKNQGISFTEDQLDTFCEAVFDMSHSTDIHIARELVFNDLMKDEIQ